MRNLKVFMALTLVLCLLVPVCFAEETDAAAAEAIAALEARVGTTAAAADEKYDELKKGKNGDVVKAVQAKLIELGYLDDKADGSFGGKTQTAVELFETEQGLIVDGVLSPLEIYYTLDCAPLSRAEVIVSKANAEDIASVQAAIAVLPIRVTDEKVLVQSKLNKETYPDMLTAVVENTTAQNVIAYTVGFLAYDANNEAVQILTQYDENGYYEILGDAMEISLPAGQTFGSSYGWRLQDNHGIVKLYALVNVENYSIVATGTTQTEAKEAYLTLLKQEGIIEDAPQTPPVTTPPVEAKTAEITVTDLRIVTLSGNSVLYITGSDGNLYKQSIAENEALMLLNVGDAIKVRYTDTANERIKALVGIE